MRCGARRISSTVHNYAHGFAQAQLRMLIKSSLAVVLLVLPLVAHSGVTSENFCFSSGGAKSINFQMRTYYDSATKFSFAFVRYEHSKQPIPLVLANSERETLDKDAPDQKTTTWSEVVGGQVTGDYEMITQGTEMVSMIYTSKRKGQQTGFMFNANAIADDSCKW